MLKALASIVAAFAMLLLATDRRIGRTLRRAGAVSPDSAVPLSISNPSYRHGARLADGVLMFWLDSR
jgi:hypothetical protein